MKMRTRPNVLAFLVGAFLAGVWPDQLLSQDKSLAQHLKPDSLSEVSSFLVDVTGPDVIAAGDIGDFDVGKSTATKFAWTIIPSTKNFRVDTSLRKAYLAGASGTFTIVLVGTSSENDVAIDTQTVTIGTGPVPVPPGPGPIPPGPGPAPQPTDPLAKQMVTWLAQLKGKVTATQLAELGKNYASIAAEAVATPGAMTKSGFVAATQTQNVRVLGPTTALDMRDPFFKPLAAYMQARKIAEDDEAGHAELWRNVAAALEEVSKTWQ